MRYAKFGSDDMCRHELWLQIWRKILKSDITRPQHSLRLRLRLGSRAAYPSAEQLMVRCHNLPA